MQRPPTSRSSEQKSPSTSRRSSSTHWQPQPSGMPPPARTHERTSKPWSQGVASSPEVVELPSVAVAVSMPVLVLGSIPVSVLEEAGPWPVLPPVDPGPSPVLSDEVSVPDPDPRPLLEDALAAPSEPEVEPPSAEPSSEDSSSSTPTEIGG